MDFRKLVLLSLIAAVDSSPGQQTGIETSKITCEPTKEGQSAHLDARLFKNSDFYIIQKENDIHKITCHNQRCFSSNERYVILYKTSDNEDNFTSISVQFHNSSEIKGNWVLQTNLITEQRIKTYHHVNCELFENIKNIFCENTTDSEGLQINCRSSDVSNTFKCFFELQINEVKKEYNETNCSLHISKHQLTQGIYNVTVTYYPENYWHMKILLGTSKNFIFEQYGPTVDLEDCLHVIEEQKQILCRCINKTEVQTIFWFTDGKILNSSLLNLTAQKGRYEYFCNATDQHGIFNSSIVYEFNVTAFPKIKVLTNNDKELNVLINKSEEIIIKCEAENQENNENHTIELIKNNKRLTPTNITRFTIEWKKEKAECGDSGLYTCLVTDNITKYNNESHVQLTILFCEQMKEIGWIIFAIALACVAILLILISSAVVVYRRNRAGNFNDTQLLLSSLIEIDNLDIYNCDINTHNEKYINKSKLSPSIYMNISV